MSSALLVGGLNSKTTPEERNERGRQSWEKLEREREVRGEQSRRMVGLREEVGQREKAGQNHKVGQKGSLLHTSRLRTVLQKASVTGCKTAVSRKLLHTVQVVRKHPNSVGVRRGSTCVCMRAHTGA